MTRHFEEILFLKISFDSYLKRLKISSLNENFIILHYVIDTNYFLLLKCVFKESFSEEN